MMINETVILLCQLEDYSDHILSKHIYAYLRITTSFDLYFFKPLQRIFSKVIPYDFVKRITEIGLTAVNKEILDLVREERPKYVLWIPAYHEFQESTFDIIRKEGTMVIGWFGDDDWHFDEYSKWWAPYLDYCVTNAIEAVPKYKELGARVIQAIPCTGVSINRDLSKTKEKYDISFVGSRTPYREQNINELKNRNLPIHVFGRGWGGNRCVSFEEMVNIFNCSKINLNFSRAPGNKLQLKGRIFEVCLAGGFLLTEYVPEIEKYFDIGKEIVCFRNTEEMINKIIYYLVHNEERQAIARAGWKRAASEHTSFHMVSKVFDEIEKDSREGEKSSPKQLKMPMRIRRKVSRYYFNWGVAFLSENYNRLWTDALTLSIRYYPFDVLAWYHYISGFLPFFMRTALIKPYIAAVKLRRALLVKLGFMSY